MCQSLKILTRYILICFLCAVFVWQTWSSLDKYFARDTIRVTQIENVQEMDFPSVSLCAYYKRRLLPVTDFVEAMNYLTGPEFPVCYNHGWDMDELKPFDINDGWEITITGYLMALGRLSTCYTYTAKHSHQMGYLSGLSISTNTEGVSSLVVIVHPRGQNMLQANNIHGRDFDILGKSLEIPPGKHRSESYEIVPKIIQELPKDDKPCHEDDKYNIRDCLESYVEEIDNCVLPWRKTSDSNKKQCTNRISYWKMEHMYYSANEFEIYKATGCYFGCSYHEFKMINLFDDTLETTNNLTGSNPNYQYCGDYDLKLKFFLTSKGIVSEKEVLAFDLLDLAGNIGGFLGLLLGASILSLFDWITHLSHKKLKAIFQV